MNINVYIPCITSNCDFLIKNLQITKQVLSFIEKKFKMSRKKEYSDDIVLEKAMHVFWNNGYEATSVRLLEKEMGINQFSIYSSFSNKRQLFIESLKKYQHFVISNLFVNLLKEDSKLEDFKKFLNDFVNASKNNSQFNGCLIVNTTIEIGKNDKAIAIELGQYYEFIKEMLINVLINSVKAGEIDKNADIEKYSNYLLGIMQGLSVGAKILSEKQLNDYIDMALSNIK